MPSHPARSAEVCLTTIKIVLEVAVSFIMVWLFLTCVSFFIKSSFPKFNALDFNIILICLTIISAICAWTFIEFKHPRSEIYLCLNWEERPPKNWISFIRGVTLLLLLFIIIVVFIINVGHDFGDNHKIPNCALGPITVLIGAVSAALGWMYTRYKQDKAERVSATMHTIQQQLYGETIFKVRNNIMRIRSNIAKENNIDNIRSYIIPTKYMNYKLDYDSKSYNEYQNENLEFLIDYLFNIMDGLSLSVRYGQLDYTTIEKTLRSRFVRLNFVFSEYIKESTNSVMDNKSGYWYSTTTTWEHMLWLNSQFMNNKMLHSDDVEFNKFIRPPRIYK